MMHDNIFQNDSITPYGRSENTSIYIHLKVNNRRNWVLTIKTHIALFADIEAKGCQ